MFRKASTKQTIEQRIATIEEMAKVLPGFAKQAAKDLRQELLRLEYPSIAALFDYSEKMAAEQDRRWDRPVMFGSMFAGGYAGHKATPYLEGKTKQFTKNNWIAETRDPRMGTGLENDAARHGYKFEIQRNARKPLAEQHSNGQILLNKNSPPSVIAHEFGHLKNEQDLQKLRFGKAHKWIKDKATNWTKTAPTLRGLGLASLAAAGMYGLTGNEYVAAGTPLLMATPGLLEEAVASGRGLNALYKAAPQYSLNQGGVSKLLKNHGKVPLGAFSNYAAKSLPVGIGMFGAAYLANKLLNR